MIVVKVIGAIITVFGTSLYGWTLARQLEERIRLLNNYKDTLIVMGGYIRSRGNTVAHILRDIAGDCENELIRELYMSVAKELNANKGETFSCIWHQAMEECMVQNKNLQDVRLFMEMCQLPVHMDLQLQIRFLQERILKVEERIAVLREEAAKKGRVYKSLGISAGVLIVLVLI